MCAISRAVNVKVMLVVAGDYLHHLQLFDPYTTGVRVASWATPARLQKLADTLNAEGHPTKEGKPFHAMQVKRCWIGERDTRAATLKADGQHPAIII